MAILYCGLAALLVSCVTRKQTETFHYAYDSLYIDSVIKTNVMLTLTSERTTDIDYEITDWSPPDSLGTQHKVRTTTAQVRTSEKKERTTSKTSEFHYVSVTTSADELVQKQAKFSRRWDVIIIGITFTFLLLSIFFIVVKERS